MKEQAWIVGLIASLAAAALAVTGGSMWIDEFATWQLTQTDNFGQWWAVFKDSGSDVQFPLYHMYLYYWSHLFGADARSLRLSNVPFFVLANVFLLYQFRRNTLLTLTLTLTACLNPFLWYYLNEARPYVMVYFGVSMIFVATVNLMQPETNIYAAKASVWLWGLGSIIAVGATVLSFFWLTSSVAMLGVYRFAHRRGNVLTFLKEHRVALTATGIPIALLATHDVFEFLEGTRATTANETTMDSALFSMYMLSGMLGIGPGMLSLREHGGSEITHYSFSLAIACAILSLVAIGAISTLVRLMNWWLLTTVMICIATPIMLTFMLGLTLHWRVVGRHLTPLVLLVVIFYALGIAGWWQHSKYGKAIAAAAIMVLAYSTLSIRFAERHAKDDYRAAAELAEAEMQRNGLVWWAAYPWGALYYDISPRLTGDALSYFPLRHPAIPDARQGCFKPCVEVRVNQSLKELEQASQPSLVLLSKPDLYDQQDGIGQYLRTKGFTQVKVLQAFTVWRPGS